MTTRFSRALAARKGATPTEYMVMLILVAMVVLGVVKVFGGTVSQKYAEATDPLSNTLASDGSGSRGAAAGDGSGGGQGGRGYGAEGGGGGRSGSGGKSGEGPRPGNAATAGDPSGYGASPATSAAARAGGRGGGSKKSVSGGGNGPRGGAVGPGGKKKKKEAEDLGGLNPLVLVIALMLLFGLFFVMTSGKKD